MAKQSDHIDNRFREAAENISVPPNPIAWEKMEQLLDGENRRRPVVFWWYLLAISVLGLAGFFSYQAFDKLNKPQTFTGRNRSALPQREQQNPVAGSDNKTDYKEVDIRLDKATRNSPVNIQDEKKGNEWPQATGGTPTQHNNRSESPVASGSTAINRSKIGSVVPATFKEGKKKQLSGRRFSSLQVNRNKASRTTPFKANLTTGNGVPLNSGLTDEASSLATTKNGLIREFKGNSPDSSATNLTDSASSIATTQDKSNKDSVAAPRVKLTRDNDKWKLARGLNLSVIGKLDATALHHISLHEFRTLFGFGLGYRVSNRISVQTGLFVQRAIYFAGPEDYTVKAGTYLSMYRLSKIDANCLFYEIPLNLRYDFVIGKSIRFYSTAGFNSYIMKNESYRYHATGNNGYRMFDSTYTTNRNIFASVSLSAGIEKKLTPAFSVQLEPYITLPNAGIGAGKVKLYSGGAQFSIKLQPVKSKASVKK